MTTYLGKSCSFCLPRVPFVNCKLYYLEGKKVEIPEFSFNIRLNIIMKSKMINNDQELIQSDPTSFPQKRKGNN